MSAGPGNWYTKSKTDPRWNMGGRSRCMSIWGVPEMEDAIKAKEKGLGEEPPEDMEYGGCKD